MSTLKGLRIALGLLDLGVAIALLVFTLKKRKEK